MPDIKQTSTSIEQDPLVTDTPAKKLAAAILGVLVVIIFIVLLISGVRFVKDMVDRAQTKPSNTLSVVDPNKNSLNADTNNNLNSNVQTVTYTKTPVTGPRENLLMFMGLLFVAGYGLVVVSKKVF